MVKKKTHAFDRKSILIHHEFKQFPANTNTGNFYSEPAGKITHSIEINLSESIFNY